MNKLIMSALFGFSLVGCSATDYALLSPEASYSNGQKVTSIPTGNGITVLGSKEDEFGNQMFAYPSLNSSQVHKIAHFYPVPEKIRVECDYTRYETIGHIQRRTKLTASGYAEGAFQAGKTYMVFCNTQADNRYEITAKEVPNGTKYGYYAYHKKVRQTAQPDDTNRVRFTISTKKSSQNWLRWAGGDYMAIRNWDGKLGKEAELALPIEKVEVECQSRGQMIMVPLVGDFKAGKTYRLGCRETEQGFEAYVISEK